MQWARMVGKCSSDALELDEIPQLSERVKIRHVAKEQVKFQLKLTSIQDQLKKSESTLGNRFAEMLQEQRNSLLAEIAG